MSAITIRPYEPADQQALVGLLQELQAYEFPFAAHYKPAEAMGAWYIELLQKQSAELDGVILMAIAANQAVGMATLFCNVVETGEEEELPYVYAHISELVVTATARGMGVGRALLAACEARAKLAGRDEITLAVFAENKAARGLYDASGFVDYKIRQRKKLT